MTKNKYNYHARYIPRTRLETPLSTKIGVGIATLAIAGVCVYSFLDFYNNVNSRNTKTDYGLAKKAPSESILRDSTNQLENISFE